MVLKIEQFTCRSDNFGVLIHDTEANVTASIDAPEFQPIVDKLAELAERRQARGHRQRIS